MIGQSEVMRRVFELTLRIAASDSTVLITGESGTGKELVARTIHDRSRRASQPFVAVNCGAIPEDLLENELFGHVRGAFTGAQQTRSGRFMSAKEGTIFLDEIGEITPRLQTKLLRVLQEREFNPLGSDVATRTDARFVAATNRDLREAIPAGLFREDLYYRLAILSLELPPLRARRDDIPPLIQHFLKRYGGNPPRTIEDAAMTRLRAYDWPGNVREMENLIERLITLTDHIEIRAEDLPELSGYLKPPGEGAPLPEFVLPSDGIDIDQCIHRFQREMMVQALERANGNKTAAAILLGLNRTTFIERMRRHGLGSLILRRLVTPNGS
ncbi:MAG: sigma 54-interacting transcriptional regulator [Deltaproteobacteria bacterium]|nr:sigma 54-interacting transcriptional regulator [Deltaproteobacteria bacterium]